MLVAKQLEWPKSAKNKVKLENGDPPLELPIDFQKKNNWWVCNQTEQNLESLLIKCTKTIGAWQFPWLMKSYIVLHGSKKLAALDIIASNLWQIAIAVNGAINTISHMWLWQIQPIFIWEYTTVNYWRSIYQYLWVVNYYNFIYLWGKFTMIMHGRLKLF